ncbi:MAG: hypothetical protein HY866_08575, partial [Chloroflexi bacterium]|nr:hypothetical protein [Chloroflexota bacterium]
EFDDPIFTETSTTTSYTPLNPLAYEFYVWRVQAQDAVGNWGPYSPLERQFFVSLHKSPITGTSTTNTRPTFSWNGATGATSYEFELDNNFDFSSPIWEYSGTGKSTRPPTALPPGTYQWRVKANNTAWMLEWIITITPTLPAKPVQVSPANKALLNDNTPTFTWNAVIGATVYQVQIDNQSKFTSPEQDVTVGSLLLNYIASDLTDGTYYWRVRASNSLYAPGSWSSVRSITIDSTPPEVPVVTAPVDQTSMTNTKFSLAWSKVKDAVRYEVQIDPDAGFPLPPSDVGNKTTYKPATPLARGVYNWHVRAIDKAGNASAWSPARTFEIVAGVTGADPTQEPTAEILPTEAPPTIDPTEPPTLEPTVIPPDLPLVTLESDDPAVMQTGVWTAHDTELASGGRYLYSSGSLDDALTFTFSGVQLDVIYVKHPALGQFIVEVDGAPLLLADSTAPEAEFGVRGSITLGAGEHTARLYPLFGTIAIDAFEVQTQIAPPVVSTPEPTTEPTAEPTTELTSEPPAEPTLAPTLAPTSTPLPVLLPFGDTFDSGLGWTTSGLWALDPQAARSGMGWWIDSTQREQVSTLTYSGLIDLTTAQNPQLGFWQKGILSTSDVLSVEVSLDGGLIWWPAQRQSTLSADWMWQTVDLNAYRGNVIALRFVLSTVDTLPEGALTAGFGLDDLLIQDVPFTPTLVPPTLVPPTLIPTDIPTLIPTDVPTLEPTESPTEEPTLAPTDPPAEERQTT